MKVSIIELTRGYAMSIGAEFLSLTALFAVCGVFVRKAWDCLPKQGTDDRGQGRASYARRDWQGR